MGSVPALSYDAELGGGREMRIARILAATAMLALLGGCVTVAAQRKLERRVSELEHEGGTGSSARLADLGERLEKIQREIKQSNGRIEVAEHRVDEALSEARAARQDAAAAVDAAHRAISADEEPAPDAAGEEAKADSVELKAYRGARAAWSDGNLDACIDRFRSFMQTFPSSTYAENASYWMADCYFKRGDYKTAVLRFDDVVARYPQGTRAPDALYRQGEALLRLGPNYGKAASKAFERVVREYPDSARALEAKKQLEVLGSG